MKNGFVGRAAENYFDKVYNTIRKGEEGINDGNQFAEGLTVKDSNIKKSSSENTNYMSKLDMYGNQLNASLSSYCVAVNDDKYDFVASEILKVEEEVNNRLNYAINSIEILCSSEYILPETTPKIEKILEEIKNNLPESADISKTQKQGLLQFMNEINDIDK